MSAACPIPPEMLAMMRRGVSVIAGSRDAAMRPSVMRAMGSLVAPDGSEVTVFLSRSQSAQLIQDIASTGRVAVVFSEPATHRTVQVKTGNATVRPVTAGDAPALSAYVESMVRELDRIGLPAEFARAMFASQPDDLVAVTFRPEQAFDQTPGPRAGTAIGGAA